MKTKRMLLYCCTVLMFMACKKAKEDKQQPEKNPTSQEADKTTSRDSGKMEMVDDDGRMVLVSSVNANNYNVYKFANTASTFKVQSDYLFLDIPVADTTLRIKDVRKISNETTDAILVWLKGSDSEVTNIGKPVTGLLQESYSIRKLKLNEGRMKKNGKIKVFLWNNDTLTDKKEQYFRKKVRRYDILDFDCEEGSDFLPPPAEECGDILTGG